MNSNARVVIVFCTGTVCGGSICSVGSTHGTTTQRGAEEEERATFGASSLVPSDNLATQVFMASPTMHVIADAGDADAPGAMRQGAGHHARQLTMESHTRWDNGIWIRCIPWMGAIEKRQPSPWYCGVRREPML